MDDEALDWLRHRFGSGQLGYLVDVGAGDGRSGSLSRRLLEMGWEGTLIDPLPVHAAKLRALYRGNQRVKVVECAVMPEPGEGLLYPFREVSTTNPDWARACADHWDHVKYSPPLTVAFQTLDGILDEADAPTIIDLLKVDTEGMDLDILKSLSWDQRHVQVVVVEVLDMLHLPAKGGWKASADLVEFMDISGYTLETVTTAGNAIFSEESL